MKSKKYSYTFLKGFLILITFFKSATGTAQTDQNSELYKTIISKDSLFFNLGFNTCDSHQYDQLLSDKFEFLHDKDGISDKNTFLYNFKNGLCKSPATYKVRRELVKESTEIYPLYNKNVLYGAIQEGEHKFYETISGKQETYTGAARFTNVWFLENGNWKMSKSLSYNHHGADMEHAIPVFDNDESIEKWLKEIHVPTLGIGVIKEGNLQQIKVFGELEKGVSAPYNTIFNVASLTKPVTAMVALKLASIGKWDLDEPVYKYWTDPDVAKDKNSKVLTTRHILTHQTGFSNWRGNNKDGKLHFETAPGTKYQYSGEGFEYLRRALESKFNKPLDLLASELIFEPLKMTDTQYFWNEKTDIGRFAIGYDSKGNVYETVKNRTANGADDLLTTIKDYSNFLISMLKSEGLSKKIFDDMVSRQASIKKDEYFGLGFVIYDFGNGEYALSHGGADKGCQTIAFIFPKTKQGLVIFTNVDDGYKVYEKLLTHYLGDYGRKIITIETK